MPKLIFQPPLAQSPLQLYFSVFYDHTFNFTYNLFDLSLLLSVAAPQGGQGGPRPPQISPGPPEAPQKNFMEKVCLFFMSKTKHMLLI